MIYYFVAALLCAAVGALPFWIARKPIAAATISVVSFFGLWAIFYLSAVSTVWPLFGVPGLTVLVLWVISAAFAAMLDEDKALSLSWAPAAIGVVAYAVTGVMGSEFMRTEDYQGMIGQMETRSWTQDVQPKDPRHMRMVTKENALARAQSAIGQDGTIGSQLEIIGSELTLQKIGDELWYVAPLEFKSWGAYRNRQTSPGYVKVSAENPAIDPQMINFPEGQEMHYAPSAYWSHELERHLRQNGYLDKGLDDYTFEIDENGHGWWVVTVFDPTIMWWGEKVTGVVIVDPATGETKFSPLGQIPDWVDRAIPDSYVKNYLGWWGDYVHGWGNSALPWTAGSDIVEPGEVTLIYGEGGQPEWVTDITSNNASDNSIVGVVYTNSRTGKSVYYKVKGGATNEAILEAVNHNKEISFQKLYGADPQLYNVYGTMAAVVPLFNAANLFSGVAIVPINNRQQVAYGNDTYEALREYERLISNHGEQTTLGSTRKLKEVVGIVDRINAEINTTGTLYYIHVTGVPHLFTSSSGNMPKLTVTRVGDRIKVQYYDSERDVVPLNSFDNLSLPLTESKDQAEVKTHAQQQRTTQETQQDSTTLDERLKHLSPEQMRKALDAVKQFEVSPQRRPQQVQ